LAGSPALAAGAAAALAHRPGILGLLGYALLMF
jgi:hypothetical protein